MMRGVAEICTPMQAASLGPPLYFKAISVASYAGAQTWRAVRDGLHPSSMGMTSSFPMRSSIPRPLAPLVVGTWDARLLTGSPRRTRNTSTAVLQPVPLLEAPLCPSSAARGAGQEGVPAAPHRRAVLSRGMSDGGSTRCLNTGIEINVPSLLVRLPIHYSKHLPKVK